MQDKDRIMTIGKTRGGHDGRMGLADAYMVFVGFPTGLTAIGYCIYKLFDDSVSRLSKAELWGMGGMFAVMIVGMVLMNRDPGMRRNMKAARLRAERREARRSRTTIITIVHPRR